MFWFPSVGVIRAEVVLHLEGTLPPSGELEKYLGPLPTTVVQLVWGVTWAAGDFQSPEVIVMCSEI